jgi:hypothetical protein
MCVCRGSSGVAFMICGDPAKNSGLAPQFPAILQVIAFSCVLALGEGPPGSDGLETAEATISMGNWVVLRSGRAPGMDRALAGPHRFLVSDRGGNPAIGALGCSFAPLLAGNNRG